MSHMMLDGHVHDTLDAAIGYLLMLGALLEMKRSGADLLHLQS